jgi:hypothetical protein
LTQKVTDSKPHDYLTALENAELLLKYAAETGIQIDPKIRNSILHARTVRSNGWNEGTTANLLTALTDLAAQVKPVTLRSLQCSKKQIFWVRCGYYTTAISLALVIGTFSVATFVASALSSAIRADIVTASELAVKLRVQLGPLPKSMINAGKRIIEPLDLKSSSVPDSSTSTPFPSGDPMDLNANDVIGELQQFATTIRAIDARARQLNWLVFLVPYPIPDPFADIRDQPPKIHEKFELPEGLPNLAQAASDRIAVYQEVRYFAQNILDEVSFCYGAITACILPVLYALLGACAYLLRSFKKHIRNQTYIPHYANSARFIIAAIGGAVVGLFNNISITQVPSISPLAIAFLVGYAVDVFYAFLDGLLQKFIKNGLVPPLPASAEKKPSPKSSDPSRTEMAWEKIAEMRQIDGPNSVVSCP